MALNIGTGLLLGSFTNYNFGDQEKVLGVTSVPEFSPEYIMHNDTFSSTKTFPTLDSIQNYHLPRPKLGKVALAQSGVG